jgi:hypothetical protein
MRLQWTPDPSFPRPLVPGWRGGVSKMNRMCTLRLAARTSSSMTVTRFAWGSQFGDSRCDGCEVGLFFPQLPLVTAKFAARLVCDLVVAHSQSQSQLAAQRAAVNWPSQLLITFVFVCSWLGGCGEGAALSAVRRAHFAAVFADLHMIPAKIQHLLSTRSSQHTATGVKRKITAELWSPVPPSAEHRQWASVLASGSRGGPTGECWC